MSLRHTAQIVPKYNEGNVNIQRDQSLFRSLLKNSFRKGQWKIIPFSTTNVKENVKKTGVSQILV